MTDARQPKDPEGGALLWSPDGTLTVRKTPAGYHVLMEIPLSIKFGTTEPSTLGGTLRFDVQQDDLEAFIDQLKRLSGGY